MELSVKELLQDYFSKEQLRDALREIEEPVSGNKDRLARRLRDHWESHNRNIYELLDFTDTDSLETICNHYKVEVTFKEKEALKEKIEKANLLFLDKKPDITINKKRVPFVPKTKSSSDEDGKKSYSKKTKSKTNEGSKKSSQKKLKTTKKNGFSLKKLFSKITQ